MSCATAASSARAFRASVRRPRAPGRARGASPRAAPAPAAAFDGAGDDAAPAEDDLLARLHVTFLALRRGSRFAAQEFAIVATEAYERGVTIPSLRMDISLLGLSTASDMGLSEQDAFLSHLGMCMMTLWELDWPSRGAPAAGQARWSPVGGDPEDDREARGLLAYIRATHQRSDAGFTLKRMEMERIMTLQARGSGAPDAWDHPEGWGDTQRLNRDAPDNSASDRVPASQRGIASRGGPENVGPRALGETDAVRLMRVNCRLTLLLREFVFASRGLRPVAEVISTRDEELDNEELDNEVGVEDGLREKDRLEDEDGDEVDDDAAQRAQPQVALEWCATPREAARTLAARLLVAYVSCLTSHPAGLRAFAAAALDARAAGVPAVSLAEALDPAEFDVEGSRRGMFGSSADAGKFFALFLTSAYVAADEDDADNEVSEKNKDVTDPSLALLDPDMFAWAPAPGEAAGPVGWAAVAAGAMSEDEADEAEERRRRSVSGMRASVRAWMAIDRAELKSQVSDSLSVDEDDPDMSQDERDDVAAEFASASASARGAGSGDRLSASTGPPGDIPWRRDDLLTSNSATIAALTIQRAVVSFTLQEKARRRAAADTH